MLRTSFAGDSSNDTNSACSPRSHAAAASCAASVVFPVPDVPLTSTVVPRYTPPPSMWSSRGTPVEMRSVGAP